MRKHWAFILLAVAGAALLALFVARLSPGASTASSHREAPLISEDPTADNTDRKSTRLNSSHIQKSRMPSSA